MKIVSFNVNGLRSFDRYVSFRSRMSFNDHARTVLCADILCVQETRGDAKALHGFHTLRDYVTFSSINRESSGRCGVSTMISKQLYCRGVLKSPYSEAGRSLLTDHGGFKILNVYFPFFDEESRRDKTTVMEFYNTVGEFIRGHDDLIVCGDFNAVYSIIDHYQFYNEFMHIRSMNETADGEGERRPRRYATRTELPYTFSSVCALESYLFEVEQRRWMKALVSGGCHVDVYRVFHKEPGSYTCWNTVLNLRPRNLGTRIDYILVPSTFIQRVMTSDICPEVQGSDHCPVYVEMDLEILNDGRNILCERRNNILEFLK